MCIIISGFVFINLFFQLLFSILIIGIFFGLGFPWETRKVMFCAAFLSSKRKTNSLNFNIKIGLWWFILVYHLTQFIVVWLRPCYLLPCNVSSGDCWQRPADTRKGWDIYFSFWYYFCSLIIIIIFDVENCLVLLFLCLFVCFCFNFSSWRHFPSVCYFFLPVAVTSYTQCCRLQWCDRVIVWVVGNIYIIFKY